MTNPMSDPSRAERLQIMLTKHELEVLDSWRFTSRMPSRAAAIRELLKRGLAAEGFDVAEAGIHSKDFGVTGRSGNSARLRKEDVGLGNGQGEGSDA